MARVCDSKVSGDAPPRLRRRLVPGLLLAGILLLAALLRFQNLETRQPRISDEADYLMEAQWISSLSRALLASLEIYQEERRTGKDLWKKAEQMNRVTESIRGHAPYLARPGHVLLIALTMQLGMDPVLAGAWESAVFGTLTVLLLCLWGRALYGTRTALLAGFLLAISAFHVWYSRNALSEADTTFFLLLTLVLFTLAARRGQGVLFGLTGLAAGTGFVIHHRFLLFFAAILAMQAWRLLRAALQSSGAAAAWRRVSPGRLLWGSERGRFPEPESRRETRSRGPEAEARPGDASSRQGARNAAGDRPLEGGPAAKTARPGESEKRTQTPGTIPPRAGTGAGRLLQQTAIMVCCFALPAGAVEMAYHLAAIVLQGLGRPLPCPTYFTQLAIVFAYIRFDNLLPYAHFFSPENLFTYPYLFWYLEGPLYCLLLPAGIFALARRRGGSEAVIALFLLAPLAFYTLKTANARFACSTLPFASLAIALFLGDCLGRARRPGTVPSRLAPLALLVVLALQTALAFGRMREHDRLEADWRGAMRYLEATGAPANISVYPHLSRLYLGHDLSAIPAASEEGWRELFDRGFHHLVLTEFVDYYSDRFDFPEMLARLPAGRTLLEARALTRRVYHELKPVFEAPCDFCISPLNILEINLNFRKSLAFMKAAKENGYGTIKIYDLTKSPLADGQPDP